MCLCLSDSRRSGYEAWSGFKRSHQDGSWEKITIIIFVIVAVYKLPDDGHLFRETVRWFTQKFGAVKLVISNAEANEIFLNNRYFVESVLPQVPLV